MAAASAAVLALTLAACGEGDAESRSVESTTTESTDPTPTPSATSASPSPSPTSATGTEDSAKEAGAENSAGGSGKGGGTGAGGSTSPSTGTGPGGAKPVDCATGSLKFAIKKVKNPVDHVLITATNTGSKACHLYSYPALRISENSQAVTARVGESKPGTVVTLDRGATGYAGLITASADRNSETKVTTPSIGLSLFGPDEGPTGSAVDVPVPGGSLYVEEDNAQVTYWQDNPGDALAW
ncbi:DUF4232 domain-containing protein [Streptomyces sp. YU58]|uniref:DUF4232 domain-containing protein n=1 Tax=Streptomyces sp. SX92 TaxID=3158972 RepID=UPI0027B98586|nr:DUF4232 domain-containing protein [Streptomyces coralus]WLW57234.1 DUF4232 domain-containing protein [Streptomyces coralus]